MQNFIATEAQELLNTVMDEVGGFEGSSDQWNSILDILKSDNCLSTYLSYLPTNISEQIIAKALAIAKEVLAECD